MNLKICGQKHNIADVAGLRPDYLGFIFWEPSSRYFDHEIPPLPPEIKRVGIFVDAPIEKVLEKVSRYNLDAVQLHGNETPEYCATLKNRHSELVSESQTIATLKQVQGDEFEIIKVFSIKDDFDFSRLQPYEDSCDYFLFDTKGKLPGGNGYVFDWEVLQQYPSTKPYFLSGGIGLENLNELRKFLDTGTSKYCYAIDVNSKFETEPGRKDIKKLKEFKKELENELSR